MSKERKSLVRVEVPMVVNGHQLPAGVKHEKNLMNMDSFKTRYITPDRINLSPCYQRDSVWTIKQQRSFIQSCFNPNMSIPPFYLAKKKGGRGRNGMFDALDCRQRATSLKAFLNNEFWIRVKATYSDGSIRMMRLDWQDIETNDDYVDLRDQFLNRPVDIVIFDYMDYEEQRKIFVALNAGSPLNADELNYCPNFLIRRALQDMFEIVFKSDATVNYEFDPSGKIGEELAPGPGLASAIQTGVRCENRFAHLRVIHECLILTTGLSKGDKDNPFILNGPKPRSCKRKDRLDSAEAIHIAMGEKGLDYDDAETSDIIEFLGLDSQVKLLRDVADVLALLFDQNTTLGRKINSKGDHDKYCLPRQVIDALCFLYTIVHDKHWSLAKLKGMKSRIVKWLEKYYAMKNRLGDYNMATSDALTMTGKYRILRLSFNKMFGEDVPEWDVETDLPKIQTTAIDSEVKKLRRLV